MIDFRKIGQLGSKRLSYGLMTKTYPEHGLASRIRSDYIGEQASLRGYAGAGAEQYLVERLQLVKAELVVAVYGNTGTKLLDEVRKIICEGVIVVYDDYLAWFANDCL